MICECFDELALSDVYQRVQLESRLLMYVIVIIHALLMSRQVLGTRGFSQVYTFSNNHLQHAVSLLGEESLIVDGKPNVESIVHVLVEVRCISFCNIKMIFIRIDKFGNISFLSNVLRNGTLC